MSFEHCDFRLSVYYCMLILHIISLKNLDYLDYNNPVLFFVHLLTFVCVFKIQSTVFYFFARYKESLIVGETSIQLCIYYLWDSFMFHDLCIKPLRVELMNLFCFSFFHLCRLSSQRSTLSHIQMAPVMWTCRSLGAGPKWSGQSPPPHTHTPENSMIFTVKPFNVANSHS